MSFPCRSGNAGFTSGDAGGAEVRGIMSAPFFFEAFMTAPASLPLSRARVSLVVARARA
jgi:hypothetical protein